MKIGFLGCGAMGSIYAGNLTKENCGDILADAKAINEGYAAEAETVEDTSAEG